MRIRKRADRQQLRDADRGDDAGVHDDRDDRERTAHDRPPVFGRLEYDVVV
jgi:hypothetical protein